MDGKDWKVYAVVFAMFLFGYWIVGFVIDMLKPGRKGVGTGSPGAGGPGGGVGDGGESGRDGSDQRCWAAYPG